MVIRSFDNASSCSRRNRKCHSFHSSYSSCTCGIEIIKKLQAKIDDSSNDDLLTDNSINNSISTRSGRRKLKRFFKKHQILKICIVSGLSFAAIMTLYPPARKIVKKLLFLTLNKIKYKLDDKSSLNDPNSSELPDNIDKSKWGRALALLIPVLGIVFTVLNRGKNESQSIPVNVNITSDTTEVPFPEVPFSRAMRDIWIQWCLLCLPSLFRGFFFGG